MWQGERPATMNLPFAPGHLGVTLIVDAMRVEQYIMLDETGESYVGFRAVPNLTKTQAWFARDFERDPAIPIRGDNQPLRPLGEFLLVATVNGVEVRYSTVRTEEHLECLLTALAQAQEAALNLLYGRDPLDQGGPDATDDYVATLAWEDEVDEAVADLSAMEDEADS